MQKNKNPMLNLIFILALISLACQSTVGLAATPTPSPSQTPTITPTPTQTPRPTNTATSTPTPFIIQAESMRKLVVGGFNYTLLDGLEKQTSNHGVVMYSEDDRLSIMLSARAPYPGEHINTSLKYYFEWVQKEFRNVAEGEREQLTHDEADGVSKFFTAQGKDGKPLQGRITYLRPENGKILLIEVYAHGEGAWEEFGEKAYQTTLEKISFFKIIPWEGCPLAEKPSYGFTKENPIKVGGELLSGPDREEQYLSALLGKNGELVSYYREGTVEVNGVIIDEFKIVVGSATKTLYLNIYDYEPTRAPSGMTCAGPLP